MTRLLLLLEVEAKTLLLKTRPAENKLVSTWKNHPHLLAFSKCSRFLGRREESLVRATADLAGK